MPALQNPAGKWKISPTAFAPDAGETAVVPGGWFGGWLGVVPYWQQRRSGGGNMGVTDGSDALPGQVGEYLAESLAIETPVGYQQLKVSLKVLPPGDWDAWAWMQTGAGAYQDLAFYLSPQPAGFSNQMSGSMWGFPGTTEGGIIIGTLCRALISVPTWLAFAVVSNATAAGTTVLHVETRRRR